MKTTLDLATCSLTLRRHPFQKNQTLQAWDASDEYLIEHLSQCEISSEQRILLFNDHFGALTCWARRQNYTTYSVNDSVVSQMSIRKNAKTNGVSEGQLLRSTDDLSELSPDIIVLKLPKSHRLLTWQLQQISTFVKKGTQVVATGKARDIHTSTLTLFEKYIGATTTSLAKKKARLIFSNVEKQLDTMPVSTTRFNVPEYQLTLDNHPNVFSAEKLDIAAYLMLAHIPSNNDPIDIIDLGCGNGVLGIQAAKRNPNAHVTFVDESYMAIESAKMNAQTNAISSKNCTFLADDCLTHFAGKAHLILCNPPFHQASTLTDHIAWQMFMDAKQKLHRNGKIHVIGNRHLGYHTKLKRLFGNSRVIASNAKFVIVEAIKK